MTGGSRGIGRAAVLALARSGCDVAVNYRSAQAEADSAVKEVEAVGRRALAVAADVPDEAQVAAMVAEVEHKLGPVDVLINNAGVLIPGKLEELTYMCGGRRWR